MSAKPFYNNSAKDSNSKQMGIFLSNFLSSSPLKVTVNSSFDACCSSLVLKSQTWRRSITTSLRFMLFSHIETFQKQIAWQLLVNIQNMYVQQ